MKTQLNWLRSNLVSLLLALLLALTVWIVASLEENPSEENDFSTPIPIEIVGLAPGLEITNDYTDTTRIRLRAQQETWNQLSSEDITAVADLSGYEPGVYTVEIDVEIDAPAILVNRSPEHIRIEIEARHEREMPVQLVTRGQLPIGFESGTPVITPPSVTVEGPRSRVDRISEVRAEISIEGRAVSFTRDVPVVALDSQGNPVSGVTLTPEMVNVELPILQQADYLPVSIIPDVVGTVPLGYYVSGIRVTPQTITVQGDPRIIERMQPYVETQQIDITNQTDDVRVEVGLVLPEGVTAVDTQTVEVLISIAAQLGSRQVIDVPVQYENLDDGLAVELSPPEIDIILSGPSIVLDTLDPQSDIRVTVNLAGREPGTYQIEPRIFIAVDDVRYESFFPIVIEVEITEADSTRAPEANPILWPIFLSWRWWGDPM